MSWYQRLRPLFFRIPPETAHHLGLWLLERVGRSHWLQDRMKRQFPSVDAPVDLWGLRFGNRVGLAAGYDKDGIAWRGLATLGFGHLELGTVTPRPQPGNPRPRVFRLSQDEGLINRLGFPSDGADAMAKRLEATRGADAETASRPILGINLGKQKETPLESASDDYRYLVRKFAPHADYLAVNISSPNTPQLRELQTPVFLGRLIRSVVAERDAEARRLGKELPLLVKIAPDSEPHEIDEMVDTLMQAGADGLIATNTTVDRSGLQSPNREQAGGASGRPLAGRSLRVIERVAHRLEGQRPLIAVGGIFDGVSARARIDAGADLVQVYTGLVFRGPGLVREVADALRER